MVKSKLNPKLRRELILAKLEQHDPVTDYELAEIGIAYPPGAGWWRDAFTFTWHWVPATSWAALIDGRTAR